ncbi:MAG: Lrp/AsnC family transcriptional regulator [Armatimonadetes bacterium]|nr:Lrp/AsnC family transcriptional regulator [Armatimonadota bacterium]
MLQKPLEDVERVIAGAEASGVIRRYKAVVDWEKAGDHRVAAFIDVKVTPTRGVGFDDVAERIYNFREVVSVYLVSGEYDLRVVVEGSTMQEVANFVSQKLATVDRVQSTASHFVLKRYKEDREIFADAPPDHRLAVTP